MPEPNIQKAISSLSAALSETEEQIYQEIGYIAQQIEDLKGRVIELQGKQEALSHDRVTIQEMYEKYCLQDTNS